MMRLVVRRLLELIVGPDHPGLVAVVQRAFGLIDVLRRHRSAHRFQADVELVQQVGIGLDAHRGLRRSPHKDLADALNLRQLLAHDRVGHVVHLVLRHGVGGHHQNHDRGVGGIDLAIGRIAGQIGGQISARRIDGGLHVARRRIDVAVQVELHGDAGGAQLARRGHLVDAGDAAELPLQRSRHRGSHRLRTGARQRRADRDHREIDLRQRRNRKLHVGQGAGQKQGNGQQRGGDGPFDGWCGDVHDLISERLRRLRRAQVTQRFAQRSNHR